MRTEILYLLISLDLQQFLSGQDPFAVRLAAMRANDPKCWNIRNFFVRVEGCFLEWIEVSTLACDTPISVNAQSLEDSSLALINR